MTDSTPATAARWAVVIVVDDGTRADRDELFAAIAAAAGPFTERMGVDVMGLPMDEVSEMRLTMTSDTAALRLAVEHSGHRFEWRIDGVYLDGEKVPGATTLGANERGPIIEFGPWGASKAAKDMLREVGWNV